MTDMLSPEIRISIKKSVLCWLATSSSDNQPNVSPKEIFEAYEDDCIIIANIASPQSVKNIHANNKVCVSFIDILVQKGYQLKGIATIIEKDNPEFSILHSILDTYTQGKFPITSIIKTKIESSKAILAPSYIFYPETSEESQIQSAKDTYHLK